MRAVLCLLFLAITISSFAAEEVSIPNIEAGRSLPLPGVLHKPDGDGPFPAVVMLVGCGGYAGGGPNADHQSSWARKLVEWGYVALQVDSYSPRGPSLNCDFAGSITISRDAFAAKSYLSTLPYVDPENIAVVGWSMGGIAALKIIDAYFRQDGMIPFKAAVAFYPQSFPVYKPDTPLLILIGEQDKLCNPLSSKLLAEKYEEKGWKPAMVLVVYPDAGHAFDLEGIDLMWAGHHLKYDPQAAADATERTRDFLAKHLGSGSHTKAGSGNRLSDLLSAQDFGCTRSWRPAANLPAASKAPSTNGPAMPAT
jgi:dienelactone hydrolase